MGKILITTELGEITLALQDDKAPITCKHVVDAVKNGVFSPCTFYRSDFVIQFGLHGTGRTVEPALSVNESQAPNALSNTKGAVAVAHWDVPDCGSSEYFISLKENSHLDSAYGGYCVFAVVELDDASSWKTIDAIAASIATKQKPTVTVKSVTYAP